MIPICRDDDEEFLHNIIREGTRHEGRFEGDAPEYGGSEYLNEYLNDTGDGDTDQPEEMTVEDVRAEVYGICAYI